MEALAGFLKLVILFGILAAIVYSIIAYTVLHDIAQARREMKNHRNMDHKEYRRLTCWMIGSGMISALLFSLATLAAITSS
ncbi:MAG: hypothetical protein MK052_10110 [Alphaproteobacteria bacterium]|nr:hypothetical protein [Alphaproteobacteria bacterium]